MLINKEYRIKSLKRVLTIMIIAPLLLITPSCEDFVDIDPPITEVISETVYSDDQTAIAAVRGIYAELMLGSFARGGLTSVTVLNGLSADELLDFTGLNEQTQFVGNNLNANNSIISSLWTEGYTIIYYANSVLNGLNNSTGVTGPVKSQLEGEALFIRAFFHFYLTNLYGGIPLITSTDFRVNTAVTRDPQSDVYQQIIEDLLRAQELLSADYSFSDGERVQPNRFAVSALLARVYLYLGDWSNAEIQASSVIDNSGLFELESDLNNVFLANSTEAIWQLRPVIPGRNTAEAEIFINPSGTVPFNLALANELANAFESGDERRSNWVDTVMANGTVYHHPYKYKVNLPDEPLTEYSMVLRLAEQYLIRAEARAQQGNIGDAQQDLNVIRNRAGLDNTTASDQASLLPAIEQERRVELFAEWGHRWLDLKRTDRVNVILPNLPIKDWQPTDGLYPIPLTEREVNDNLTQNDGY